MSNEYRGPNSDYRTGYLDALFDVLAWLRDHRSPTVRDVAMLVLASMRATVTNRTFTKFGREAPENG